MENMKGLGFKGALRTATYIIIDTLKMKEMYILYWDNPHVSFLTPRETVRFQTVKNERWYTLTLKLASACLVVFQSTTGFYDAKVQIFSIDTK